MPSPQTAGNNERTVSDDVVTTTQPNPEITRATSSAQITRSSSTAALMQSITHNNIALVPRSIIPPLESKSSHNSVTISELPKQSFHAISRVKMHDEEAELVRIFFRKTIPRSNNPNSVFISELEAVSAAYYRFLAPGNAPVTYAVYDASNEYVAVDSEEIPDFKPLSVDPLQEDDLNIDFFLANNCNFELFDKMDSEVKRLEEEVENLNRKINSLSLQEKKMQDDLISLRKNKDSIDLSAISVLEAKYQKILERKSGYIKALSHNAKLYDDYFADIKTRFQLTKRDIEKYAILKGLAYGMTTSYIFNEDDLHRNNMSKKGVRVDFDKSRWPFGFRVSDNSIDVSMLREPAADALSVYENDIARFPLVSNFKPFYWPTQTLKLLPVTVTTALKNFITLSTNPYPLEETLIYQQLESNLIFKHHMLAIMLKYILTNADIYKQIAKLHMRKERNYNNRLVIDIIGEDENTRIRNFETVLMRMPMFADFFEAHGKRELAKLLAEIAQRNLYYADKLIAVARHIKELTTAIAAPQEASQLEKMKTELREKKAYFRAYTMQKIDTDKIKKSYDDIAEIMEVKLRQRKNSLDDSPVMVPAPTPVLVIEGKPGEYERVKTVVIKSMDSYINPSEFLRKWTGYGGGYLRTHKPMAEGIIKFCNEMHPDASDTNANVNAITKLKLLIEEKLAELKAPIEKKLAETIKMVEKPEDATSQSTVTNKKEAVVLTPEITGLMYVHLNELLMNISLWELAKSVAPEEIMTFKAVI